MTLVFIAGVVLTLLAVVAWGSAWLTMHWLADAEDLLERIRNGAGTWPRELDAYVRRTPRRP